MHFSQIALALAFLYAKATLVTAGLYIVEPLQGSVCRGGQPCTISWLDDGTYPLLPAIGPASIGLYTGEQRLVQSIPAVDVSKTASVTFTPNPSAGPNSDSYYLSITSLALQLNDSLPYSGWSPFFKLRGMSGSFDKPLPEATSSIPIPSTLTRSSSSSTRTITLVKQTPVPATRSTLPSISTSTSTSTTGTLNSNSTLSLSTSTPLQMKTSTIPSQQTDTISPPPAPSALSGAVRLSTSFAPFILVMIVTFVS